MSLYAVSRDNGESLYVQIARQLEQEVATGMDLEIAYRQKACLRSDSE